MARKRLFWQLMPSYLLIILVAILVFTLFARNAIHTFYEEEHEQSLHDRAAFLQAELLAHVSPLNVEAIEQLCQQIRKSSTTRVTIMLPSGHVIADTHEDASLMENHANRPEIRTALTGSPGTSLRFSHTLQQNMTYYAVPLSRDDTLLGILRLSLPQTALDTTLKSIQIRITLAGFLIALAATMVTLYLSHRISRPLNEMTSAVERFARGDFDQRIPEVGSEELGRLADSMNWMAAHLGETISTMEQQHNEQEAVLSSMVEGMLAVDNEEHIINMNPAAAALLDIDATSARNQSVQEAIRNTDLQQFIAETLKSQQAVEGDIVVYENETRYLQAHGTVLRDADGRGIGALVVLNDVTRLRRLENVRRDFVANVSHELKTPITSIKGFVETLQDGALDSPADARRFLGIIARQSDRLTAIIEDLLILSRLEQEGERSDIGLSQGNVRDVLAAAIEICDPGAEAKNVTLLLDAPDELNAMINPVLLEQAVVNLIDNAIKYSESDTTVQVWCKEDHGDVCVGVTDHGPGIPKEHQDRLFERFYRVDKARSREMGGTGLGLAIVKHIALAHGGSIHVSSTIGQGSTFTLHVPQPKDTA